MGAVRAAPPLLLLLWLAAGWLGAQDARLHEVCGACHTEPSADLQEHPHFARGLQCDACHGPSKAHREATGHKPPDRVAGPADQPAVCGACHAAERKSYEAGRHAALIAARSEKKSAACTTCHGTHAPRTPAGILAQCKRCHAETPAACQGAPPAGAPAARVACAACHDQHRLTLRR